MPANMYTAAEVDELLTQSPAALTPDAVRQIVRDYLVNAAGSPLTQNTAGKLVVPGAAAPPTTTPSIG